VVYCGIDLAPFTRQVDRAAVRQKLGLPLDKPVISYVARFVPHKNHAQLVRVADRLNRDGNPYHFALAGSHGPLLSHLQEVAAARSDLSLFVGLRDISDLLLASDVFFFPSLEEGFGLVAVEAAAAGLPVVATDLPTIREATAPGHHPFMFPPDDDAKAEAALRAILGDPALRARLADEARQWAPRFSIGRSVAHLEAIYRQVGRPVNAGPPLPVEAVGN
jgi:glycosyltransferase involved in cell wall biosynthesis